MATVSRKMHTYSFSVDIGAGGKQKLSDLGVTMICSPVQRRATLSQRLAELLDRGRY